MFLSPQHPAITPPSAFCRYRFAYSGQFIETESCSTWSWIFFFSFFNTAAKPKHFCLLDLLCNLRALEMAVHERPSTEQKQALQIPPCQSELCNRLPPLFSLSFMLLNWNNPIAVVCCPPKWHIYSGQSSNTKSPHEPRQWLFIPRWTFVILSVSILSVLEQTLRGPSSSTSWRVAEALG